MLTGIFFWCAWLGRLLDGKKSLQTRYQGYISAVIIGNMSAHEREAFDVRRHNFIRSLKLNITSGWMPQI